jgi:hypothetical protein
MTGFHRPDPSKEVAGTAANHTKEHANVKGSVKKKSRGKEAEVAKASGGCASVLAMQPKSAVKAPLAKKR